MLSPSAIGLRRRKTKRNKHKFAVHYDTGSRRRRRHHQSTATTRKRERDNHNVHESRKRSKRNSIPHIHESILESILFRLPIKSLLRFKCVCKSWYALITSRDFNSIYASTYLLLDSQGTVGNVSLISLATGTDLSAAHQELPTSLSFTTNDVYDNVRVCGPCNGIFCLSNGVKNITLWNPATKESKSLPRSQISRLTLRRLRYYEVGLGFDVKTDDYKVLQTLRLISGDFKLKLYSLRGNSWKKLKGPINLLASNDHMLGSCSILFQNNINICWVAKRNNVLEIVLFDVSNEEFQIIGLPSKIIGKTLADCEGVELFTFGESMALVCYYPLDEDNLKGFDIWVSNGGRGDGNDKFSSWTKMYSTKRLEPHRPIPHHPIGFCEDGRIVFQVFKNFGKFSLYDPRTNSWEFLKNCLPSNTAFGYKESLVALSL